MKSRRKGNPLAMAILCCVCFLPLFLLIFAIQGGHGSASATADTASYYVPHTPGSTFSVTVKIDELAFMDRLPANNQPPFAHTQVMLHSGDKFDAIGHFTTTLMNGVKADFVVANINGQRLTAFLRLVEDHRYTTNLEIGAYNSLPKVTFP